MWKVHRFSPGWGAELRPTCVARPLHSSWPASMPGAPGFTVGRCSVTNFTNMTCPGLLHWRTPYAALAAGSLPPSRRHVTLVQAQAGTPLEPVQLAEDFSLDACLRLLELVRSEAAQQSHSSAAGPDVQQALQTLREGSQPGDLWLLVHCGNWHNHSDGWTGPAHALLQLWYKEPGFHDYFLWVVEPSGWPNGKYYMSCTELENLTTKVGARKYLQSFKVKSLGPRGTWVRQCLKTWMSTCLGDEVRLVAKRGLEAVRLKRWNYEMPGGPSAPTPARPIPARPRRAMTRTAAASRRAASSSSEGRTGPSVSGIVQESLLTAAAAAGVVSYQRETSQTAAEAVAAAVDSIGLNLEMRQDGPAVYILSDAPGPVVDTILHMDTAIVKQRHNILKRILEGQVDMSKTHVTLDEVLAVQATATDGGSSQVYDMGQLSRLAEAAVEARQQGQVLEEKYNPCVPDPHKPFTITLNSGKDGKSYVVAHYEPRALQTQQARLGLLLSKIYHARPPELRIGRTSAPENEDMVMSGLRMPRKGGGGSGSHFGKYAGDTGPEGDQFSCVAWPYLMTTGALQAISGFWAWKLPEDVNELNRLHSEEINRERAAEFDARVTEASNGILTSRTQRHGLGNPANFPAPCMLGAPFTTLAVTHNYMSKLHAEPGEHSFNFITWQDVLSPGSVMTVGHFWLTAGLAFTPLPGSALYIDVRLVPHKSDPCKVHNGLYFEEGRYGAALFIKPPVLKANAKLWSLFDWSLEMQMEEQQAAKLTDRNLFGAGIDREDGVVNGDDDGVSREGPSPAVGSIFG